MAGAPRQRGAALLAAMLTVTLVATFAAAALWQQFRSIEIETAERARVQASWILTGSLDWARLLLREDARSGGADHLGEPWAVPLKEARLASFLAVDSGASDTERQAFLSGQVSDLQARLNLTNLVDGERVSTVTLASLTRLADLLGVPSGEMDELATQLVLASKPTGASSAQGAPLKPERASQLRWLGVSASSLALLEPFITLLPTRTPVNLNTASAEVIYACTPNLEMAEAQRIVASRQRSFFRNLSQANAQSGRPDTVFNEAQHAVASRFFEVQGSLRIDQTVVQQRSVVQRDGLNVRTLWRESGVVNEFTPTASARP
jgi:general secretion pathway protein K